MSLRPGDTGERLPEPPMPDSPPPHNEEALLDRFWAETDQTRTVQIFMSSISGFHDCCRKCGTEEGYLARYIHSNGNVAIRWVCVKCEEFRTRGDLAHAVLDRYGLTLEELPIIADNSLHARPGPPCEVCGEPSVEAHHWAPRSIFPDWGYHLTVDLCKRHHDEWHARMREHGLRWPHELLTR